MATKYTILETAHTEESDPYSRKEYAVRDADDLSEQYPGTEFVVTTASGKVVHKVRAESVDIVDETPTDDVPEVQVTDRDADDAEADSDEDDAFNAALAEVMDEDPAADSDDAQADTDDDAPDDEGDADELDEDDHQAMTELAAKALGDAPQDAPAHGLEVVTTEQVVKLLQDGAPNPQPAGPAELELCAANTNAKRMHYRSPGQQRTACGSANTSRRANAHQVETASLCPNCKKLAGGKSVDSRPAGTGRGATGRRKTRILVMDAGEVRDMVAHLKGGAPYAMTLTDGTRIEVVGGDPATGEPDVPDSDSLSDIRSINIVSA